jgi:hypothetical protein
LQKALKDRSRASFCQLDKVLLYHIECPDYVKKFDNPNTQHYLKRQLFNILLLPYTSIKLKNAYNNLPKDILAKDQYMPYPEEVVTKPAVQPFDKDILKKFVEDSQFTPDEPRE